MKSMLKYRRLKQEQRLLPRFFQWDSAVFCVVAAVFSAFALRLYHITEISFTFDEYLNSVSFLNAPDLISYLKTLWLYMPETPPVYFILQYLFYHLTDISIPALRFLPLLLSMLSFPLLYFMSSRLFSRKAALAALVCLALSPMQIWWSQGLRPYMLLVVISLLSVSFFLLALKELKWRWIILNAGFGLLLLFTYPTALPGMAVELAFVFFYCRNRNRRMILWFFLKTVPFIVFAFWLFTAPHLNGFLSARPALIGLFSAVAGNEAMIFNMDIPRISGGQSLYSLTGISGILLTVLFVLSLCWLVVKAIRAMARFVKREESAGDNREGPVYLFVASSLLLAPLLMFVLLYIFGRTSYYPRYTIYTWPLLYAVLGGMLASLPGKWLFRSALLLLIVLYAVQLPELYRTALRADWRGAGEWLREHAGEEDLVLVGGEYLSSEVMNFNLEQAEIALPAPVLGMSTVQAGVEAALYHLAAPPAASGKRTVWLLLQAGEYGGARFPALEKGLEESGLHFISRSFPGGDMLLLYGIQREDAALPEQADGNDPVYISELGSYNHASLDFLRDTERYRAMTPEEEQIFLERCRRVALHLFWDPWDIFIWGLYLLNAGLEDTAITVLQGGVELNPSFASIHLALGVAEYMNGDSGSAEMEISRSLSQNPFMKGIYGPFRSVLFSHPSVDAMRHQILVKEERGIVGFQYMLYGLYASCFDPRLSPLPLGLSAPDLEEMEKFLSLCRTSSSDVEKLPRRGRITLEKAISLWSAQTRAALLPAGDGKG